MVLAYGINTKATVTGIMLLSQQYHVSGYCDSDEGRLTYDKTANSPLSMTITGYKTIGVPPATHQLNAHSEADLFHIAAKSLGYDIGQTAFVARANVEATWIFSPLTNDLRIAIKGIFYNNIQPSGWSLTDITTDTLIIRDLLDSQYDNIYDGENLYYFDPTHQYKMEAYYTTGSDWGEGYWADWDAIITPEPTTILLLGLGAFMLRKRG